MSEVDGQGDIGGMPGLNGLLIGAAGKRGGRHGNMGY